MISRRKFLQGALGFTSAAIIPAGILMPVKAIELPRMARVSPFNFYPNPEDDYEHIYGSDLDKQIPEIWQDEALLDHIIEMGRILDEKNVPQHNRIIRVTNPAYRMLLENE
jgi:hypothetical protein